MEIKIDVNVNFTPLRVELVQSQAWHCENREPAPMAQPVRKAEPAPTKKAEPIAEPEPEPIKKAEPKKTESDLPFQVEEEEEQAPATAREERPEDVLPRLRERFGIPALKEDRTEEQLQMARALNKCVVEVIREVTHNGAARSIADLRDKEASDAFCKAALLITYDTNTGTFKAMPF